MVTQGHPDVLKRCRILRNIHNRIIFVCVIAVRSQNSLEGCGVFHLDAAKAAAGNFRTRSRLKAFDFAGCLGAVLNCKTSRRHIEALQRFAIQIQRSGLTGHKRPPALNIIQQFHRAALDVIKGRLQVFVVGCRSEYHALRHAGHSAICALVTAINGSMITRGYLYILKRMIL